MKSSREKNRSLWRITMQYLNRRAFETQNLSKWKLENKTSTNRIPFILLKPQPLPAARAGPQGCWERAVSPVRRSGSVIN